MNNRYRDVLMQTAASLAAAISLLERAPTIAASKRMQNQMLQDYRAALEAAREILRDFEKLPEKS